MRLAEKLDWKGLTDDSDCFSSSNCSKGQIVRSLMMVIEPKHVRVFLM
jgi:hypothetical protein